MNQLRLNSVCGIGIVTALLLALAVGGWLAAPLSAQSKSIADLSVAEQDALAERYRSNFLRELSPDDWYGCYTAANIGDDEGPVIAALRKAKISEAQLKLFRQKEVFSRFLTSILMKMGGEDMPAGAEIRSCNASNSAARSVSRGRSFTQGLNKILGAALQLLGVGDVALISRRISDTVAGASPEVRRSDEEMDAFAQDGLRTATSIVARYTGDAEAATFAVDPPRVKAQKLAIAAGALTQQRAWPGAFFLHVTGGWGGISLLQQHYRDLNHLDARNWGNATEYERGVSVRRMYVDQMREYAAIGAGKVSLDTYLTERSISTRFDTGRFVGEAFGVAMRARYHDAEAHGGDTAPGFSAEDIRVGAYVYTVAMRLILVMSL